MARLTISLSDDRHQALKELAARRGTTIGALIDASLEFYGVKTRRTAEALVSEARALSRLTEDEAMRLAVDETRAARAR